MLTAIVLTLNEAAHIEGCLNSLAWADRLLLVDSYSEDETVALAKKCGAQTILCHFQDYAQQRNAALQAAGEGGWIFFVDADERGSEKLGEEIWQKMEQGQKAAFFVPRHNYIFGKLTKGAGWYPDYQLRLFKQGKVTYERPVHEVAVVDGETGYLTEPLIHYNYQDKAHFHETQKKYTAYDAGILQQQGIRPKIHTPYTQMARQLYWRFVTLKGYQDGFHGLRLSGYMAYYEWLKYRQLAQLNQSK